MFSYNFFINQHQKVSQSQFLNPMICLYAQLLSYHSSFKFPVQYLGHYSGLTQHGLSLLSTKFTFQVKLWLCLTINLDVTASYCANNQLDGVTLKKKAQTTASRPRSPSNSTIIAH